MEYCHGGSIGSFLRKGNRLNETELRDVLSCALLGLSFLHNQNVVHRVTSSCTESRIGRQAGQSPHIGEWSGESGRLWPSPEIRFVPKQDDLWHGDVHGSRSVYQKGESEVCCVVPRDQCD